MPQHRTLAKYLHEEPASGKMNGADSFLLAEVRSTKW